MTRFVQVLAVAVLAACSSNAPPTVTPPATASLKEAFEGSFLVGAALNQAQFTEQDQRGVAIVKAQFNTVTPENILKWEHVHPRLGEYAFTAPDQYVAFGERNGMFIVGHALVWHQQTPRWVFFDANNNRVSRDTLLARLRDHIHTVVRTPNGNDYGKDLLRLHYAQHPH